MQAAEKKFRDALFAARQSTFTPGDLRSIWRQCAGREGSDEDILAAIECMRAKGLAEFSKEPWQKRPRECLINAANGLFFPKKLHILRAKQHQTHKWESDGYYWHSQLSFWRSLAASEKDLLAAINEWLLHKSEPLMAPLNERSLEICGDEKKLARMTANGCLFGGLLPLGKIHAFVPQIPASAVSYSAPGKPALIVENLHTWWSIAQWNHCQNRYSAVVYGGGAAFNNFEIDPVLTGAQTNEIEYFGDIDSQGIEIAQRFQAKLSPGAAFRPALPMYAWLLAHGKPRLKRSALKHREFAYTWFGGLGASIIDLLEKNLWLPQEWLGIERLTAGAID